MLENKFFISNAYALLGLLVVLEGGRSCSNLDFQVSISRHHECYHKISTLTTNTTSATVTPFWPLVALEESHQS